MNNGNNQFTQPGAVGMPRPQFVAAPEQRVAPMPHPMPGYIPHPPHPDAYAQVPETDVAPTKSMLYPAIGTFLAVLVIGMLAFQQFQIGRLQQEITAVKTDITAVRQDISLTNRKADSALAAIRKAEALQDKVCTIPLIGGMLCSWLGLEVPKAR